MTNTVLQTNQLTKQFGRLTAVNNLSLQIKAGEVFGMLGPNGSGKTTTLGMLMQVIHPTSGSFTWYNEMPTPAVRRKIGAVLEHPIFYPYLSGQRNLELNAQIKQADPSRIEEVLALTDLTARKNDPYKNYSLGMKQRLAIASALVNNPDVLILDEPTNGLDPMGIVEIRTIIRRIAEQGKTIILASHLLDEVQKVCTHFAVLQKGNLIFSGSVHDVLKTENWMEIEYSPAIKEALQKFSPMQKMEVQEDKIRALFSPDCKATDVNRFLAEQQLFVNHLVMQKKSLEHTFLEILGHAPTHTN